MNSPAFYDFEPEPSPQPPSSSTPTPGEPLSWGDIFGSALTSPTVETYEQILNDPKAKRGPWIWLGISYALGFLLSTLVSYLFNGQIPGAADLPADLQNMAGPLAAGTVLSTFLCCFPVSIGIYLLGYAFSVGVLQLSAKLLGGTGTFSQLAFMVSVYMVPLNVITTVLSSAPLVKLINIPLALYAVFLNMLAVRVVHKIGWGKSFVVAVVIPLLIAVIIGGLIFIIAGAYFLEILRNLQALQ